MPVGLFLLACTGAAPGAPTVAVPEPTVRIGRFTADVVEEAQQHDAIGVSTTDKLLVRFDGTPVILHSIDRFDSIDLPPVDDPQVIVVGLRGTAEGGLFLIKPTEGWAITRVGDFYDAMQGGWSSDGKHYTCATGAWDVSRGQLVPLTITPGSQFVDFSPDAAAYAEFEDHYEHGTDTRLTKVREFRVRSTDDGRLLQTMKADVPPVWLTAVPAQMPWPLTAGPETLWFARHLDWQRTEGGWSVSLAAEPRPWPPPAVTTKDSRPHEDW